MSAVATRDFSIPSTIDDAFIASLSSPQQMALAMTSLDAHGFCQDVAGQIVVRGERDGTYWTNPWGYAWDSVRASDMLLVDDQSRVLEGNPALKPSPSLELHFGILRKRPDIGASVHNHPPLATAWSATARPVEALDQTSAIFFERQAWFAEFEAIEHLYDTAHFGRTGDAIGPDAHLLWLKHHGVIVAHRDVAFLTVYCLYLERTVHLNLTLAAAGGGPALGAAVSRKMRDMLQSAFVLPDIWRSTVRATLRTRSDVLN